MMKEFGGYLPLELNAGQELFARYESAKLARFNSGRASVVAAVRAVKPMKLYIPYYNCSVVREALEQAGLSYSLYRLDENLEPQLAQIEEGAWLLWVNYFGIASEEKIRKIAERYRNVIFDNTQAFFAKPVLDGNCMNAYSPRKFIGLVDGGYLVWSGARAVSEDYPQDVSWERASFLFKSIELGTNAAYQDNLDSKLCLADGIKRMSVLTQKMLCSVDYDALSQRRDRNFRVLAECFRGINQLQLPMEGFAPFVYPLVIEDPGLRRRIVGKHIYTPQWWKYLLEELPADSVEARLSRWLLPLPVDQRYSPQDMEEMAGIILAELT
ncbi:MAG: hypothetical protein IIY70_04725 [Oscillospiraceae bacterium]|nr:hypothetical protein [Oscillospiraceae bacterium]